MHRPLPLFAIAHLLLLGAGCKADAEIGNSFGGGAPHPEDGEVGPGTDGDGGGDDSGDGDDNGDDGDGGAIKYDVEDGDGHGGPGDGEEGCGRVDFLFVIDASGSMADNQMNLIANFPRFITGIQSTLGDVDDYQVGVIVTNEYGHNIAGCQEIGALVSRTGGDESSNATCGPYTSGFNYMTEADDLPTTFACAAHLGTRGGDVELPILAMQRAVDRTLDGPGLCNEGYLRDDSLLIVVIITDEADGPGDPEGDLCPGGNLCFSPGTPTDWFGDLVAARGGIEQNIVVLSLVQYYGGQCEPGPGEHGNEGPFGDGRNIVELTEMFTHGIVGGICEDYGPYFEQAIGVIDFACDNYVPPEG